MTRFAKLLLGCVICCSPAPLWAQENDGLISEIVVTAVPSLSRIMPAQIVLGSAEIDERQPLVAADIVDGIAGISLRQNSRGETVIRIRSGEERQTPVFLDGAPLATPWDGRIDLGILPAGIIRQVLITRSAAPIEYGANAISGVVDLRTTSDDDTQHIRASAQIGSGNLVDVSAMATLPVGDQDALTLAVTDRRSDYQTIADKSAIPFDPAQDDRRTNTDQRSTSLFAAFAHKGDVSQLRLSVLHADAERGIPAEGHIDPAIDSPRYWRYPLWRLTQATLSGSAELGGQTALRGVFWHQWFAQDVDSYSDSSYSVLEERESGRDRTFGARLTLSGALGDMHWRLSGSALSSTHRQIESQTSTGTQSDLSSGPPLRFRQQLFSAGAELDIPILWNLDATLGAGVDVSATPITGDKPAQANASAPSLSTILRWQLMGDVTAKLSLAQRTRFATLREQFGRSLGKFLPNPGLKPERARTAELAFNAGLSDGLRGDLAIWANDSRDTLGQRVVQVDGRNLRQRYNMRGAFTYGLEASVTAELTQSLTAEVSAAFQGGNPRSEPGNPNPKLVQQVQRQIGAALDWTPLSALDLRAEYQHHGPAVDLDETGAYAALPSANIVNLRAFWTLTRLRNNGSLVASFSLDNLTDALRLPQLGLPAPGRTVRLGLTLVLGGGD